MTEVVIHADVLRIEISNGQPEIPDAPADVPGAAFDVIHRRRAVLFVQLRYALEPGLPRIELWLQAAGAAVALTLVWTLTR